MAELGWGSSSIHMLAHHWIHRLLHLLNLIHLLLWVVVEASGRQWPTVHGLLLVQVLDVRVIIPEWVSVWLLSTVQLVHLG